MPSTALYFDEQSFWHTSSESSPFFPSNKWVEPLLNSSYSAQLSKSTRNFKNLIMKSGLAKFLSLQSADPLTQQELSMVHSPAYIDAIKILSEKKGGVLDSMFGNNPTIAANTFEAASLSAGLSVQALEDVYLGHRKNAYVLALPHGHHATASATYGGCYFNNIALAIEHVKAWHNLGKVAIIDWDLHHGNGQQSIYYDRNDVLTISIHQQNTFPTMATFPSGTLDSEITARGEKMGFGYNMNIPLFPGAGDEIYQHVINKIVIPALQNFRPEIIIVASGYNASTFEVNSQMLLNSNSYRKMARTLIRNASEICDGKIVFTHEGGTSDSYVPFCALAVTEELTEVRTSVIDTALPFLNTQQPSHEFIAFQKAYIDNWTRPLLSHL